MGEPCGFYVGKLDPVCFVRYIFEVESVAGGERMRVSFRAQSVLERGKKGGVPSFPGIGCIAAYWRSGGYVEEFNGCL